MEHSASAKLAKILNILVTIAFVCNILALPLVPGLVGIASEGGLMYFTDFVSDSGLSGGVPTAAALFFAVCWQYLWRVWRTPHTAAIAAFLLFCGVCTAIILWQARRVLGTIRKGNPFCRDNARSLKRAGMCCLVVALAALVRTVWAVALYRSAIPVFTYNTLFVPLFLMGFLLCMVMSALFRQAAELKEENDLTI